MDDGNLSRDNAIRFSTNEFSLEEHYTMIGIFKRKFNLKATKQKHGIGKDGIQQYRLCIAKTSTDILKKIVEPYMHPLFMYKIGL